MDDDPVTCELLCEVFSREGFAARFTENGESALAAVRSSHLDILVSDIRMRTRLDGLALLDRVRRERPLLPVILMTAFGSLETAIRAVKEGAFDYISKPFDIDPWWRRYSARSPFARPGGVTESYERSGEEEIASGLVGRIRPCWKFTK